MADEDKCSHTELDLAGFHSDNSAKYRFEWPIPEVTKNEPCCLGIDEAGRGPVLGPMVYGTAFCPLSMSKRLKDIGFADSKTLKEEQREALLTAMCEQSDMISWATEIISPNYISTQMLKRTKCSLNVISHTAAIALIQYAIDQGVQVAQVFVDTVGPAEKYQALLSSKFPDIQITVSAKADAKFPIVSAASIGAKVVRDRVLKSWKYIENPTFPTDKCGSGYTSDPNTKAWLASCVQPIFGFTQFIRFSWSTTDNVMDGKAAAVTWEEEDDEDEEQQQDGKDGKAKKTSKKRKRRSQAIAEPEPEPEVATSAKRHRFFKERFLQEVACL